MSLYTVLHCQVTLVGVDAVSGVVGGSECCDMFLGVLDKS